MGFRSVLLIHASCDRRILPRIVLQRAGFDVLEACTGSEGVNVARTELPSVVLTELSAPVFNGFGVVDRLRGNPDTADIPVVALTSSSESADRVAAAGKWFDAVLNTPCDPARLLKLVRLLTTSTSVAKADPRPLALVSTSGIGIDHLFRSGERAVPVNSVRGG